MNINEENNPTIEQRIARKLREAEIPGREVEFDPDEAERIAFREDALSDEESGRFPGVWVKGARVRLGKLFACLNLRYCPLRSINFA